MCSTTPITLSILNDFPVVVEGVARLLATHPQLQVVEADTGETSSAAANLVLFDAFASADGVVEPLRTLRRQMRDSRVVLYTWNVAASELAQAEALGVDGIVSKTLGGSALADALVRIHGGERVIETGRGPATTDAAPGDEPMADWPGRNAGLSPREAEMVALITQGLTNTDIAEACHLSINSVKTYIRSAYRKMGVERRAQAVRWGLEHGMHPPTTRRSQ